MPSFEVGLVEPGLLEDREERALRDVTAVEGHDHAHDQGARVLSTQVPEVQQRVRRPDFVLTLQRQGQVYLRHLEFQDHQRRGLVERTFAQNCTLWLQYRVPVVTTVILVQPPAPKRGLAYRVVLAGREMNVWHLEVVCLWKGQEPPA